MCLLLVDIPILEFPRHLTGLLGHPGCIRMSRAAGQIDPSRPVFDEKEYIQRLQDEGSHRQKIAGQELLLTVREKGASGAARS
jgi:hypothetical protein